MMREAIRNRMVYGISHFWKEKVWLVVFFGACDTSNVSDIFDMFDMLVMIQPFYVAALSGTSRKSFQRIHGLFLHYMVLP